jgi:uncharacterized membrane protein
MATQGYRMIVGIALVVGGTVLIALDAMARAGRLTRQSVVGLRTKATLAADEAWNAAHKAGASWVIGSGAVLLVGGIATMLTESETASDIVALIAVALMLIPMAIGFQRGQAAARSV